jgi:hypothetical protein
MNNLPVAPTYLLSRPVNETALRMCAYCVITLEKETNSVCLIGMVCMQSYVKSQRKNVAHANADENIILNSA